MRVGPKWAGSGGQDHSGPGSVVRDSGSNDSGEIVINIIYYIYYCVLLIFT